MPTRGLLISSLERELARDTGGREEVAVLFIDLDNFKLVNDSLGHHSGDELLREMARRIRNCAADGDLVSRFGGDELVILHPHASLGSEGTLGNKVLTAMAEPIQIAGREVVTSVSIGVAICAPGAQSAEQLLRNADTALYAAKNRGRNRMERFNEELHARAARRLRIESDLRVALREEQLHVHYQPQVNLATGHLVGVEALARWRHPELGAVSPAEFIAVAENSGLIHELGRQVLLSACRQLAEWVAAVPGRPLSMTVNISPRQLDDPGFITELQRIIEQTGVRPSSLCMELTESALMNPETDIVDMLERIRRMGVYVAIDDFGTGHSSLARLRDLPVEVLKIDRSFIDGLTIEPGDTAIVSSILSLAFAMGKHVIAEGVERVEQAVALRGMGCRVAQGFLFSPAVAPVLIQPMLAHPLWQPSANWRMRSAVCPDAHARRAHRAFIDEFLDHIGVPMWVKANAGS
ncbi:putative bifunctional diguanylate cyclase/phosphodiesterase [Hydrogenophaga sp. OTU3427]|uniref:putative bifunctional diguanylate cyclase/phosphodiesterase n=1 Tax=Hydrogenophaga sp. OTU3427 TaxID=3043856 RepID=UPI00313BEA4D